MVLHDIIYQQLPLENIRWLLAIQGMLGMDKGEQKGLKTRQSGCFGYGAAEAPVVATLGSQGLDTFSATLINSTDNLNTHYSCNIS